MTKQTKLLLLIGALLVAVGILKPDLSRIIPNNNPVVVVDSVKLKVPADADLKAKAEKVTEELSQGTSSSKYDASKLRDLYIDLATLIELDGEQEVVKNTEEVRQANSLSGVMLRLDLKGKYENLASSCNNVIIGTIGDDNINLTPELRTKTVDAFMALAWACNEATK
jgi:hypothetical protein